jgi:hypothetical protein
MIQCDQHIHTMIPSYKLHAELYHGLQEFRKVERAIDL